MIMTSRLMYVGDFTLLYIHLLVHLCHAHMTHQ